MDDIFEIDFNEKLQSGYFSKKRDLKQTGNNKKNTTFKTSARN